MVLARVATSCVRAALAQGVVGRLVLTTALALTLCRPAAQAQPAYQGLASSDPAEVSSAIEALARSDDARALEVLSAMRDGSLRIATDGSAYVLRDGALRSLSTGAAEKPSGQLVTPMVTNASRRSLARALSRLELSAADVNTRLAAATTMARSPEPELRSAMRQALAAELDPAVREKLTLAVAQLDLSSDAAKERLWAVEALAASGELAMKDRLAAMLAVGTNGEPREADASVRKAASTAVARLEQKEMLLHAVRDFFYGASLGSILLLVALGLAITFGLMGVINMAHGEMLMLGAYTTYVVQTLFARYLPEHLTLYLPCALPCAFVVCALAGVLIERSVIRLLYGRPLETLLATWGVSLMIIQAVRLTFGASNVAVANPPWLSGGYELVSGVVLPYPRIAAVLFCGLVTAFVWWLLHRTDLGLHVRAITQNRGMAGCMGVRTARVDMLTFGLGSGIAGLSGVALSQLGNVGPELGQLYIVDSFMVVVVGGVGKLLGTVVTSLGLGFVNKVLEPYSGAVLGKILVLGFVILFIQRRPQGLFAVKGRAVEA